MRNDFTEGQHTHFYGEVESVTVHNTMHNHYQGNHDNSEGETTGFRDLHLHGNGHTINIGRPTTAGQDMKIDLDKKAVSRLGATETILVPCSSELVGMLDSLAELLKTTGQGLASRYIVEGLQKDVGDVFGVQPYLDKPLRDMLK